MSIDSEHNAEMMAATAAFSSNSIDPKASMVTHFSFPGVSIPIPPCRNMYHLLGVMQPRSVTCIFYDGPSPPPGIFDDFLTIPCVEKNVSTRSFLSLVKACDDGNLGTIRYALQSFPYCCFALLTTLQLDARHYVGSLTHPFISCHRCESN